MVSSEILVGREVWKEGGGGGERGVVERLRERRAGWGWGIAREDSLEDLSERRAGEDEMRPEEGVEERGGEGEGISTDRGGERDSNLESVVIGGPLMGMKEDFGGEEGGEMERGGMKGRVRERCTLGGDTGGEEKGEVRGERVGEVDGEVESFWKNDIKLDQMEGLTRLFLRNLHTGDNL
jgi:hypothetical protein